MDQQAQEGGGRAEEPVKKCLKTLDRFPFADELHDGVTFTPFRAEGPAAGSSASQRLILGFTLPGDLGFRWLAQRLVADTP